MFELYRTPNLYLVRHGTTDLNDANRYRGWQDVPLNEDGLQAAEEIANFFSYERIGQVISSDLQRAIETAKFVLPFSVTSQYIDFNPLVRPWNIGDFAGKPKDAKNTKALKYYIDHPDVQIPEGESLNEFKNRWERLLNSYLVQPKGVPTVIVCHTSNITVAHELCDPDEMGDPEGTDIIEPGGIVAIYVDEDGMHMVPKLGAVTVEAGSEAS